MFVKVTGMFKIRDYFLVSYPETDKFWFRGEYRACAVEEKLSMWSRRKAIGEAVGVTRGKNSYSIPAHEF